jgi:general secretion pathway protein D
MQGSSMTIDTNTGNSRLDTINSSASRTAANRNTNTRNNNRNTAVGRTENTLTDQKSNVFNTPVRVFADGVLNRLVIRTTPRTYASIKALLNRMDTVPAQVLLQVMVVEVTLTESTKFGLEFSALAKDGNKSDTLLGTNYANITKPETTESGTISGSGFSALLEDPKNPKNRFGYVQALAGNGRVKVISSPQLLVSSHTQASINVGTKVPIISSGITSTSSAGDLIKTYTNQDTGIILTITPQVTSTNLISLKVKQELSAVQANPNPEIENPYINQRIVNTSMTIANGRTMIIGGLIQEKINDSLASVPIINSIPIINRLLGSTDASIERSEILVLITGYIVNERNQLEEMIRRYNDAIEALNQYDQTTGEKRPDIRTPLLGRKDFWIDGTIYPNKK